MVKYVKKADRTAQFVVGQAPSLPQVWKHNHEVVDLLDTRTINQQLVKPAEYTAQMLKVTDGIRQQHTNLFDTAYGKGYEEGLGSKQKLEEDLNRRYEERLQKEREDWEHELKNANKEKMDVERDLWVLGQSHEQLKKEKQLADQQMKMMTQAIIVRQDKYAALEADLTHAQDRYEREHEESVYWMTLEGKKQERIIQLEEKVVKYEEMIKNIADMRDKIVSVNDTLASFASKIIV